MSEASTLEVFPAQTFIEFNPALSVCEVVEASSLEEDILLKKRADCLIGSVALDCVVKTNYIDYDIETNVPINLAEAIGLAARGNKQAEQMVRTNVTTDYLERAYKSGFISEVTLERRIDGELVQYGQNIEDVHINSLRYIDNEKLRERAKIEALNSVRDKHYANNGTLTENARVVFSMVHEDMDDDEASEFGFFNHTRSLSIKLMTEKNGELIMQSAFVAGRENLSESSFDKDAIINLVKKLGVDYEDQTTEEILGRPLLINKDLLPNLVSTLVEMFDKSAYEITGKNKFFGLNTDVTHSSCDYVEKETRSRQIADDMKSDIEDVVEKLKQLQPKSPPQATATLAELNDQLLKERIVQDDSIDVRVLGAESTYYVEHARYLYHQNPDIFAHQQRDLLILQKEINKGQSSSCPGGSSSRKSTDTGADGISSFLGEPQENSSDSEETAEDCEFPAKQCPKCDEKNIMVTCKKGKYYGSCGCVSD